MRDLRLAIAFLRFVENINKSLHKLTGFKCESMRFLLCFLFEILKYCKQKGR